MTDTTPMTMTMAALVNEILRAKQKFPSGRQLLPALVEEVGELARALLQEGNSAHAKQEAIQVACVAIRIATEGAPEFDHLCPEDRKP